MTPIAKKWTYALFAGLLWGAASVGCAGEYSLAPTFCDDWCRVTRLSGCGDSPTECVSDCELTRSSADCFPLQEELLACYEESAEALVCVGEGFRAETRVSDGACQQKRDALFECEAPGIASCLSLCRVAQQQQLETSVGAAPGRSPQGGNADAGVADACPALDEPCEGICWSLFTFTSEGLSSAGADPDAPAAERSNQNSVAACVQEALLGCFALPGAAASGSPEDKEPLARTTHPGSEGKDEEAEPSTEPASIGDIIELCVEDASNDISRK